MTAPCHDINDSVASRVLRLVNCVEHTVDEGMHRAMEMARWFRPIYDEEKGKEPFYYNVLHDCERNSEKILETIHSKILFGFLNHSAIRESFIKFFFPEIEFETGRTRLYSPDRKRIDLSILGDDFFIIVENKINRAEEQPNQVGNYVERAVKVYYYGIDKVYVLYLDRDNHNGPSSFSLSDDKRRELGNRLVCKSYKDDVMGWLTTVEQSFDFTNEPYLQRNLLVYKDYLEDKCNILNRYENMNTQIDKMLEKELGLDELNIREKVEKIEGELENVEKLQERLKAIQQKYEDELFKEWQCKITSKLSGEGVRFIFDKKESVKFEFSFNEKPYYCVVERDCNGVYWGICAADKNDINLNDLETLRGIILGRGFHNNEGNSDEWAISDYASHDDIVERYITLSKVIIEKTKSEPQRFSLV